MMTFAVAMAMTQSRVAQAMTPYAATAASISSTVVQVRMALYLIWLR